MVYGTTDGLPKESSGKTGETDKRVAMEWKESSIRDESPVWRNGDWRIGISRLKSKIEGTVGIDGPIDMEFDR